MQCGVGLCGHCQLGPTLICRDGPVFRYDRARAADWRCGSCDDARKPKLAVWKFASCDGCQLTLLDCEDELLALAGEVEIAYFLEATPRRRSQGPYDLSLVEGSITTPHDAERIQEVRRASRQLVTIGACATAGGIQALRNFADVNEFISHRLRLARSTSRRSRRRRRSRAHVQVDFELHGCPIDKRQLLEVITRVPRTAAGRTSRRHSVCMECKRRGTVCVMVAHGTPCLGPVTHAGCGALCPAYNRGCYGCFGPMETPNTVVADAAAAACSAWATRDVERVFRTFNVDGASSEARAAMAERQATRRSRPTTSPASRARARMHVRDRGRPRHRGAAAASTSRRASSRRSCAAAPSPRRPTSPRASAASARSPTR